MKIIAKILSKRGRLTRSQSRYSVHYQPCLQTLANSKIKSLEGRSQKCMKPEKSRFPEKYHLWSCCTKVSNLAIGHWFELKISQIMTDSLSSYSMTLLELQRLG